MTDEEYLFRSDIKDKKAAGRGAFHKVRGGGKYVRMPSDNLTKEEREKMNGEVFTYNLNKPMVWKEYKTLPRHIRKEYCETLMSRYNVGPKALSIMFGVTDGNVTRELKNLDIKVKGRHIPKDSWADFLANPEPMPKEEPREVTKEELEEAPKMAFYADDRIVIEEKPRFPVYPTSGTMSFYGSVPQVAQMLFNIIKGKAKITVSWEAE